MKQIETLLMTVLAGGSRHGYGLRQDILDLTSGQVDIEAGNLYRHIRSLEDEGLIAETPAPAGETDGRRIYYRITDRGRRALEAEMGRLRDLVREAESRGILSPRRA